MQHGLGAITTTAGTQVRITANQTSPTISLGAQSVLIQVLSNTTHTNTGRVFIYTIINGVATRVATLAIPASGSIPSFSATVPNATAALDASLYLIDVEVSGDGVDASYLVP
jgi:hypothetical protein